MTTLTPAIVKCYLNFTGSIMSTTGLPISQMQTLPEWVENRVEAFNEQATPTEKINGFEAWLCKSYLNR